MKRLIQITVGVLAATSMTVVMANDSVEGNIRTAIAKNTDGKVEVGSVAPSPIPGVYEVTSGTDVFYVDRSGRYGFVDGRLVDMQSKQDLTALRLEKLNAIRFEELPLNLAIKTVHGNGKRVLAVFEDPACPICKSLHKWMLQLPDATIYTFMYPVVSPDSRPKAEAAWCAPNRAQAWSSLMQGGSVSTVARCDSSAVSKIIALGEKLHIAGTPTVFLSDGRRMVGATPPDQLMAAIDAATAKK